MIEMYNEGTGELIGKVNPAEFQFLVQMLEEESTEDVDYYINDITIDLLESRRGDAELIQMLRQAVAGTDGIEITWVHPD